MYFTQRKTVQKIKYYFLESSTIKEVSTKLRYIKNQIKSNQAVTHLGSRIKDESLVKS